MKLLILNQEIVDKLKEISFGEHNILVPYSCEIAGKMMYWLPGDVKEYPPFAKAFADFELCEVKDIESIETKSYDSKGVETTDIEKSVLTKTILTVSKEMIK